MNEKYNQLRSKLDDARKQVMDAIEGDQSESDVLRLREHAHQIWTELELHLKAENIILVQVTR